MRTSFFQKLYHRTLSLADHPAAICWLGIISFIESSFFPIPADILFLPMALANRKKALFYAFIATLTSVLGGIFGYFIGMYAFQLIGEPMINFLGKMDIFNHYKTLFQEDILILWGLLLSSGLTHIPPIKVVTILSGVVEVSFWVFVISAIIGRGARFYLIGFLVYRYGDSIKDFIEKKLHFILIGCIILLALIYILFKLIL